MISLIRFFVVMGVFLIIMTVLFSYMSKYLNESTYCSTGWKSYYGGMFGNEGINLLCTLFPSPSMIIFILVVFAIIISVIVTYVRLAYE